MRKKEEYTHLRDQPWIINTNITCNYGGSKPVSFEVFRVFFFLIKLGVYIQFNYWLQINWTALQMNIFPEENK